MHKTAVAYAVGKILQLMGLVLFVPLAISIYEHRGGRIASIFTQPEIQGFIVGIFAALFFGFFFATAFREGKNLQGVKEGFAVVTIGWIALTFIGSIPLTLYLVSQQMTFGFSEIFTSFTNAFFEIMSGFTTTGATIFADIESLPDSLLFLRALSHWLGGIGIITLAIAIFPAMGVTGYQMFKSEITGPTKEKLQPRLAQTASILWGVYILFTFVETALLFAAGMNLFDAVCHSFSTMATGGFSNKNDSIAAYNSPLIEWIIIVFMFLAGINFLLHFRALRGDFKQMVSDSQLRFYVRIVFISIVAFTGFLLFDGFSSLQENEGRFRQTPFTSEEFSSHYIQEKESIKGFEPSLRAAAFTVLSITTTTGFVTTDFDLWSDSLRMWLVVLMFFGGCAGSTSGGMKMIRILLSAKTAFHELRKLAQPRLVSPVKLADQVVGESLIINIFSFVIFFLGLFIVSGLLLTIFIPDVETAFSASIATISNIGPGLAGVGAIENYGWMPIPAKWILIVSMLLGRLEIFTILILLRPKTWEK